MTKQTCLGCGRWTDIPDGYANCGTCTSRYLTAAFAPRTTGGAQEVTGPLLSSPGLRRSPDDSAVGAPAPAVEGSGGRYFVAGSENG